MSKIIISFIFTFLGLLFSFGQNAIPTHDYQVNLENEVVRQYLDDVRYEPHDSSLIEYYRKESDYRVDWPTPVMMDIPYSTAENLSVICCDDETLQDSLSFDVAASESTAELYNFIPNRVYRYQIKNGDDVLQQGKIRTSGGLRMINVCSTVFNVRDLGGWKTSDNKQLRYGKLFRGSELNGSYIATPKGIDNLLELGIGAELDLRANYNEGHNSSAFGFSATSSPGEVAPYFYSSDSGQLPSHMKDKVWQNKWRYEFEYIVSNLCLDRAIYVHCVHGKDRTGFLSFLLEGLLGVSYSDLAKEYELTYFLYNISNKETIDKVFDYINNMTGETLRDKFNAYFVNRLQVNQSDIDLFRSLMLESPKDGDDNAIREIHNDMNITKENLLYNLDGRREEVIRKGHLYIIRDSHGHTRKVFF